MESVTTETRTGVKFEAVRGSFGEMLAIADDVASVMLWGRRVKWVVSPFRENRYDPATDINRRMAHYCARWECEDGWKFEGHGESPEVALAHLEAKIFEHYEP